MNTKTIMKSLAIAMLMPAMLLTTACSNSDDEIVNTENPTNTKGYALPVTINVTRQGDTTTRATFDGSKLSFSTGDKLFVQGSYNEGNCTYAGMLDYVSDGTFSGTIMTQTEWTGTIEELLSADGGANATLLPAGYGEYGYLSIADEGTYEAYLSGNSNKAFATSKATAVEQFSYEYDSNYSSGFALRPSNAILNFTIKGLDTSTEVDVSFSYSNYPEDIVVTGKVTTDGDGTATFAIGIIYGNNLKDCTLTVGGNAIALPADKEVEAGKIYNISRSVAPATPTLNITSPSVGQVIGSDGVNYAYGSLPTGVTAVAKICYVSGSNGLALALTDEGQIQMNWSTAQTTCAAHTPAFTGGTWKLASKDEWDNMISAASSHTDLRDGFSSVGGTNMQSGFYWSSTDTDSYNAWGYLFFDDLGNWYNVWKDDDGNGGYVRACLAF